MERVEAGMMAWSRAGHDKGALYVILRIDGDFAYLADGRLRPLENPKKKRLKHLQVIRTLQHASGNTTEADRSNEEIKYRIKQYKKKLAGESIGKSEMKY